MTIFKRVVASFFLFLVATSIAADCALTPWQAGVFRTVDRMSRLTLATADFDVDGKLDVVTIAYNTSLPNGKVTLLRGNGDATFAAPVVVHQGEQVSHVAARDLNLDATIDLLITRVSGELVFLPGNGDGTFGAPTISPAPATLSLSVALAEMTGDEFVDVVRLANNTSGAESVVVLRGDGTGAFMEIHRQQLSGEARAIAAGDLDADGATDLVISYHDSSAIELWYGNGGATFDPAVPKQNGLFAGTLTIADADGDGDPDILAPNWYDETVSVHRNQGAREFAVPDVYVASSPEASISTPYSVTVADVSNDGILDLLVGALNGGFIAVLRGNGDGTFAPASYTFLWGGPDYNTTVGPVVTADLDEDGLTDVITTSLSHGSIIVLRNLCGYIKELAVTPLTPTISIGQSATYEVTVYTYLVNSAATGQVSLVEGETVLATAPLSNGRASLTIEGLGLGEHTLVARYSGDDEYTAAESAVVQHVTSETTTTVVSSSPSESVYGEYVEVITEVTSSDGTTPNGWIEAGVGDITTRSVAPAGVGTITSLPVGSHSVFARYLGDATHPPSEAMPAPHVVHKLTSTIHLYRFVPTNAEGSNGEIHMRVVPVHVPSVTGTIELFDGNVRIAAKQITESDVVLTFSGLAPGRHDFRIAYSGDANIHGTEFSLTHYVFASAVLAIEVGGSDSGIALWWPYTNDSRRVARSIGPDPHFGQGSVIGPSTFDQNTSAGVVYLYRLEERSNGSVIATSPIDLGVRMSFTDDPLLPGMTIRASHLSEIVAATNFLRGKAGQTLVTFDNAGAGNLIRASHITTLRTRINEARGALGAAAVTFSRTITAGDAIRAQDLQELREAVH